MGQRKKKKEFNDLLLPIILILAILPFITRMITYDNGLSAYPWYPNNGTSNDFFSYYKSIAFIMIAAIAGIILIIYMAINRSPKKELKPLIPLGIYTFFIILSSLFTVSPKFTLVGGMAHFESVFVLVGYCIILVYTYQIDKKEEDYKSILKALLISVFVISLIGSFQMFGKDFLFQKDFQKIIIPRAQWKDYLGKIKSHLKNNAVSLTLFNPNFASVYLTMMLSFLLAFLIPGINKSKEIKEEKDSITREKLIYSVLIGILTILLFKTYSRTGLVALFISLMVMAYLCSKQLIRIWKECCIIGLVALLIFVGIDFLNDFRYLEKIQGTFLSLFANEDEESSLDSILTNKDEILITYGEEAISFSFDPSLEEPTLRFVNSRGEDITSYYNPDTKSLAWKNFKNHSFTIKEFEEEYFIYCIIDDITWIFFLDDNKGYAYVNDFAKVDKLISIPALGPKDLEDIGSGRGYIWSRSLPLLRETLFIGKGPDTFPIIFPQSDYVGKANNSETPYTLIEKPHSFYLMIALQTGVISLIAFILFYLNYFIKSIRLYKNLDLSTTKARMGLGCFLATISFMVSGLFVDSSLQTTPIFMVFIGLGMDINISIMSKKNNH